MTDVLIVNPPSPDGHAYIRDVCRWGRKSREGMIWPQTSLAYLAAMVPETMSVRIIDAIAEQMTMDQFLLQIRNESPRFYVTYLIPSTLQSDSIGVIEAKKSGATTIAIGSHVSAVPKNTLDSLAELDFVIRHEPELSFADILERVVTGSGLEGITGVAHRDDAGQPVVTPDRPLIRNLDDLPIPKQHLLPLDRYCMPFLGKRYTWVLTNRGCPYSCTYCFEGVVWGKSVRYRSPESICRELEYLAKHNVHNVLFLADLFTFDRKGVVRLCDLIVERCLNVRWTCNSRVDTIDEQLLVKMKQAGCWLIAFGIESGSQRILDNVKKDALVSDAARAIRLCHSHRVKTWGYFVIGLPGESRETVRETIDFAKSLPLDIALFHVAVPYAGTEFYFQAVANKWLNTAEWQHFDMNDSAVVSYADLTGDEILAATKQAFREFYLRPRQIWRMARMLLGTSDLGMIWSVAKNFLSWLYSRNNDRVALKEPPSRRCRADAPVPDAMEDSRPRCHVIEIPRQDLRAGKPRHQAVRDAAADAWRDG